MFFWCFHSYFHTHVFHLYFNISIELRKQEKRYFKLLWWIKGNYGWFEWAQITTDNPAWHWMFMSMMFMAYTSMVAFVFICCVCLFKKTSIRLQYLTQLYLKLYMYLFLSIPFSFFLFAFFIFIYVFVNVGIGIYPWYWSVWVSSSSLADLAYIKQPGGDQGRCRVC